MENEAFVAHGVILECLNRAGSIKSMLAEAFYEIKSKKLFKDLDCRSFKEYMADPEITESYGSAIRLATVYKDYCVELKQPADVIELVGENKLYIMRKCAKMDGAEQWIQKAQSLSVSDLTIEVKERLGIIDEDVKKKLSIDEKRVLVADLLELYYKDEDKEHTHMVASYILEALDV